MPCAPAPLPPPGISAVLPDVAAHDDTATVQAPGRELHVRLQVGLGSGVEVLGVETLSGSLLEVSLHVAPEAVPGWRTVHIVAPDLQRDSLVASFQVVATRRHYVAAAGAGVYPFTVRPRRARA